MDIYDLTVPQLKHTLGNLRRWLERAAQHESRETILSARLAPDQFPLLKQVQTATDNAKMIAGRLAGREWPSHPDTETTIEQLYARIASVQEFLGTFGRQDFVDAADRKIKLPWMQPSQFLTGADYLVQFALPNYSFHLVTAYGIMRHAGVQLGKLDFIGPINVQSAG
jgi:uncharacterized protein